MKFYEKYYANNYEELITYYPRFYRDVFEMVEILKAHGRIADGIEGNIEQAYLNGFIDYADEATISKFEKFLEIGLNKDRTLEERRRLVKSFFVGFGKVSASLICQMVATYTNSMATCRFEPFDKYGNNLLHIEIHMDIESEDIYIIWLHKLLSKKIPANIAYKINKQMEVKLDNRNLEQIILRNLRLKIGIPFFCDFIFDGSWLLDGSVLLNNRRRYWLVPAVRYRMRIAGAAECTGMPAWAIGWEQATQEYVDYGIGAGLALRLEEEVGTSLTAGAQIDSSGQEAIENITVEVKTSDHWFFDGIVLLDGTRKFNSIYRKEAVD